MKKLFAIKSFRVLQLLVIAYLLVVLAVLIFQRRLIYLPTKILASIIASVAAEQGFEACAAARHPHHTSGGSGGITVAPICLHG